MSEFEIPKEAIKISDAESDLIKGSQARSTSSKTDKEEEGESKKSGRPKKDPAKKKVQKTITVDQATLDNHKEIRQEGDIVDFSGAVRAGIKMLQNATSVERRKIFEELNIKYD